MIASNENKDRFLVECHFPFHFFRDHIDDQYQDAFAEWRNAMNGVHLIPDARRYGKINNGRLLFWVESVGDFIYSRRGYHGGRGFFEMYIRTSPISNDVFHCLRGSHGKHFFLLNAKLEWNPRFHKVIRVKKFLTPVLMAQYYHEYEYAMDGIFADLIPYFDSKPNPSRLPTTSLR